MTPHTPVEGLVATVEELAALRVQEWLQREYDILPPVQEIERAMRTPCSCRDTEAHFADRLASLPVEGWRVVPVDPTDAMVEAMCKAHAGFAKWPDDYDGTAQRLRREYARIGYAAMIAAAPQDQRQGNEQGGTHE